MTIKLSRETTRLIDERMKMGGYADHDAVVRLALRTLEEVEGMIGNLFNDRKFVFCE